MIMQGIYINKDTPCIFLRERKNPGKNKENERNPLNGWSGWNALT
jgi:hypothetical protein